MVVQVGHLVPYGHTTEHGTVVFEAIRSALAHEQSVDVSFSGIAFVSTSFVNASFVELLQHMDLQELMRRIRIRDSSSQINDLIKRRLKTEAAALA